MNRDVNQRKNLFVLIDELKSTPNISVLCLWEQIYRRLYLYMGDQLSKEILIDALQVWRSLITSDEGGYGDFCEDLLYRVYTVAECFRDRIATSTDQLNYNCVENKELATKLCSSASLIRSGNSWKLGLSETNGRLLESNIYEEMAYRGGVSSGVLKCYLGLNEDTTKKWHDLDVVVWGDFRSSWSKAIKLGVSPEDILFAGKVFDYTDYLSGLDTSINQALWNWKGLYYTVEAEWGLRNKTAQPVLRKSFSRFLYNDDYRTSEDGITYSARLVFRHVKLLIETEVDRVLLFRKAIPLKLGNEDLVWAKRWIFEPEFPLLVQKMAFLCRKIGWMEFPAIGIAQYLQSKSENINQFDWKYSKPTPKEWAYNKLVVLVNRIFDVHQNGMVLDTHTINNDMELDLGGFVENPVESRELKEFQLTKSADS